MERRLKKRFSFIGHKKGRPNLVDDEMLQIIRDILIRSRLAGTVISRKMVIAIETGVIKATEPKILKEFGGITGGWAQNVLQNMD